MFAFSWHLQRVHFAHVIHRRPGSRLSKPYSDSRSVPDAERLIKQTYSVHVSLPADRAKGLIRKWHLSELSFRFQENSSLTSFCSGLLQPVKAA